MGRIQTVSLLGREVTLYSLLAVCFSLICGLALAYRFKKRGWKTRNGLLFSLMAALLGVLLGRIVYCLVRYDMFEDPMGRSLGLRPFFELNVGSLSVIGVIGGVLLAALILGKAMKKSAGAVLDAASVPGLFLFFLLRLVEPLSGQGFGPLMENPVLCWVPLGMQNGWGDWSLSVCFMEAVILLSLCAAAAIMKPRREGTLALCVLFLLAVCQVVPESLRRDNVLRIFIFARVTQIGYAVILFCCALAAWLRGRKRGLPRRTIFIEAGLVLLGIVLLIAGEFALDKTSWPDGAIYAVMLLILSLMAVLILRRILQEDRRKAAA